MFTCIKLQTFPQKTPATNEYRVLVLWRLWGVLHRLATHEAPEYAHANNHISSRSCCLPDILTQFKGYKIYNTITLIRHLPEKPSFTELKPDTRILRLHSSTTVFLMGSRANAHLTVMCKYTTTWSEHPTSTFWTTGRDILCETILAAALEECPLQTAKL